MARTIGVLAHVDAGKTTLCEQILYHARALRERGRVDHGSAFLDSHPIERRRGITVFAGQAAFEWDGEPFYLIDTPGHADFSPEMERCLAAMDCAVLVVSCAEGVQAHTETVWRLLRRRGVPCLLFFNKADRAGADPARALEEARRRLSPDALSFAGFRHGGFALDGPLAEALAERDDALLEAYLSGGGARELWLERLGALFARGAVFPCFAGSALLDEGVGSFLEDLVWFARAAPVGGPDEPFAARVYQVRHDAAGGRVACLKVLSGALRARDEVRLADGDGFRAAKVNELRVCSGAKYLPARRAGPGEVCAVTGLDGVRAGDGVGALAGEREPPAEPPLASRVLFAPGLAAREMLERFRLLEDEDPALGVAWDEALQELRVRVMGEVQLEVLRELVRERFGLEVGFGPCEVLYKETIAAPAVGCGHFEPLRHYAEVRLRLEPAPRGSGLSFASECGADLLDGSWQRLIRSHVLEGEHPGVLLGAPVTDLRVVLLAGRAHLKHTEGGDFRQATRRALRQGLRRAGCVALEPYYAFEIEAPPNRLGRVLGDLQRMHARFGPPEETGGLAMVSGRAPVAEFQGYARELSSLTGGRGGLRCAFDGYEPCRCPAEVVARRGYDPDRDAENPCGSVFCSHGAGYTVPWDEVEAHMHGG